MDNRKETVEKILGELNSRSGFDDWWYNIDKNIQENITNTLVSLLPRYNVSQKRELLPDFLYEDNGIIRVGVHGDIAVTDEWNDYLKKTNL